MCEFNRELVTKADKNMAHLWNEDYGKSTHIGEFVWQQPDKQIKTTLTEGEDSPLSSAKKVNFVPNRRVGLETSKELHLTMESFPLASYDETMPRLRPMNLNEAGLHKLRCPEKGNDRLNLITTVNIMDMAV